MGEKRSTTGVIPVMSLLSLLSGAVLVALVYGLSFLPTATLDRSDDIELVDTESLAADQADAETSARQDGANRAA